MKILNDGSAIIGVSVYSEYINWFYKEEHNRFIEIDHIPDELKKINWQFIAYTYNDMDSENKEFDFDVLCNSDGIIVDNYMQIRNKFHLHYGFYLSKNEHAKFKMYMKDL